MVIDYHILSDDVFSSSFVVVFVRMYFVMVIFARHLPLDVSLEAEAGAASRSLTRLFRSMIVSSFVLAVDDVDDEQRQQQRQLMYLHQG